MPSLKQLNQQYQFSMEMHELVQSTQEITVMEIQKVRQSAFENRQYKEGILDIFFDVKSAERQMIQQLLRNRDIQRQEQDETSDNKDSVIVLISTNQLFTGDISAKVFQVFAEEVRQETSDIVIIGRIGKRLFEQAFGDKYHFLYSEISNSHPEPELLKPLISTLLQYQHIDVFEGKYVSLVEQKPTIVNISGESTLMDDQQRETTSQRNFLFEPSLDNIVTFFETQITATLFRLTLDESRLANLGSRITTLESSLNNLEREVTMLERRQKVIIRGIQNRKQLQRLAGISCWT